MIKMKAVCLLLFLLPILFAHDKPSLLDRIVELAESRYPQLSGTGLVKQLFEKLANAKPQQEHDVHKRFLWNSWDDFVDFLAEATEVAKAVSEAAEPVMPALSLLGK